MGTIADIGDTIVVTFDVINQDFDSNNIIKFKF